jgi:hypothetical protein
MFGKVYAWTTRGVVAIGDAGVEELSHGKVDSQLEFSERYYSTNPANAVAWMVADPVARRVLLRVALAPETDASLYVYCYSAQTGEFTRWPIDNGQDDMAAGALDPADGRVCLARVVGAEDFGLHKARTDGYTADRQFTVTVSTVVDKVVTLAASAYSPVVGDAIVTAGADLWVITDVASPTSVTVDRAGLTTGTRTAYEGYYCQVEFRPLDGGNVGLNRIWTGSSMEFNGFANIVRHEVSHRSDLSNTEVYTPIDSAITLVSGGYLDSPKPTQRRFWTPRNFARSTSLLVGLRIRQARSYWGLRALSVGFEEMAERVAQT